MMSFQSFVLGLVIIIVCCVIVKICICIFNFCNYSVSEKIRKSSLATTTTSITSAGISNPALDIQYDTRPVSTPFLNSSIRQMSSSSSDQTWVDLGLANTHGKRLSEVVIQNGQLILINYPDANAQVHVQQVPPHLQQHVKVQALTQSNLSPPPAYTKHCVGPF